ncbi:gliding motility-associated C-terminal domain-containing protein [Algoriphagus aestuarii]|nr:gliding motility-associated C-terminal domain-containing protein [Algoriphagus aestuarii]
MSFCSSKSKDSFTYAKILFLWVVSFYFSISAHSQSIPRAGFPYCQGFIDTSIDVNSLPFTVAQGEGTYNGNPWTPYLTSQGLRLTESGQDLRGYVFIDLPFSPTYGIKTSFEYFIHTPSNPGLGDGFSFFLFDGNVDKNSFEIGGLGGSLGYAPHGSNGSGFNPNPTHTSGGLKGGYMGIGFDVTGNFGNFQEKKYGGFHDPNQFNYSTLNETDRRFYPNAITIRGPVDPGDVNRDNGNPLLDTQSPPFKSYQFVNGQIVKFDPLNVYPPSTPGYVISRTANGSGDLYSDPTTKGKFFLPDSQMFNLSSGLPPSNFNCITRPNGYRKVFIDLKPTNPYNPAIPYTISVSILKDQDLVPTPILVDVDYPYPIPPGVDFLKMGFAASTGNPYYSAIDIRNVAALVSSVGEDKKPAPPELFKEICIDDQDQVEFPFCVSLADQNTFIQCIQLLDAPVPADNNFEDDFFQCEQPGFCDLRCQDGLKTLPVTINGELVGTFNAELSDDVTVGEFNQANIVFERNPLSNFYGTITRYYKVVDNFGLESDAIPITIVINPKPIIQFVSDENNTLNPTCGGQNDGSLTGVIVERLAPDYTIEFYDASGPVSFTRTSLVVGADGYLTATFDLTGLDLGKIFVRAINPSSAALGPVCDINNNAQPDPCILEDELVYEFSTVRGTPVELKPYDDILCEGNDAIISPSIDPVYNPNGYDVPFKWYTDEDRNQELVNGNMTIASVPVTVNIANDGKLTVTGLTADGLNPKTYSFYVETDFQDNGSGNGNFCPYVGSVSTVATITVHPAIDIQVVEKPDWCREGNGAIEVTAQGGTGNKEFYLYQIGNATSIQQSGAVAGNTHTFSNLLPGDYEVEVVTQNPNCTNLVTPVIIEGPATSLALTPVSTTEEYCDLQNGSLEFTLTGGNPPYSSILIGGQEIVSLNLTKTGDTYKVEDLKGQSYAIEVIDAEGCPISITMDVPYETPSEYAVSNDEICEGQTATVQAQTIEQSSSTPTFNWFASDGAGGYTPITSASNFDGGTFSFDVATNSMSVTGLAASTTPYTYYLQVTGPKVCDQGYLPAEILVNFGPEMDDPALTMVTCFGAGDGTIQAAIPIGNLSDFEFSLLGNNGVDIPFSANNGLFENLIPGTYTLTIRNAEGCSSFKDNLNITEPSEIDVQTVSSTDPTCGEDNGVWSFTVSGGTPDAAGEYQISFDGNPISSLGSDLLINAANDFTISNLSPGSHTIAVLDANTCLAELSIDLVAQPIPVFDVDDVVICENEPFASLIPKIIDQAGSTPVFSWSYEDPSNAGTYINISSGDVINGATHTLIGDELQIAGLLNTGSPYTYYLNVSGDLVCPANPIPAEVSVLKLPEVVFETEPTSCYNGNDGKINLISSDPAVNMTYTIEELGVSNSNGNFTDIPVGTYTITAQEDGAPCNNQVMVEVEQPSELILTNETQTDPTCGASNGSFTFDISGGTIDYNVSINGGAIDSFNYSITGQTFEIKNLAPGTYSITVVDANGCSLNRPDLFTLVNDDGIDVTIDPIAVEICQGQDAVLNPIFQVVPPVKPSMKWYKDASLSQPISSNPTPDAEGIIYQITGANSDLTISGLEAGQYSYYLEISGAGICTSVEKADVSVNPPIEASIETKNEACYQASDGSITVTATGGNGTYEYSLNGAAYSSSTSWTNLAPGNYTISIKDGLGCAESYDVVIAGPTAAITINTPDIIRSSCDLDNGSIENLLISGGWPAYSVEWRKGSPTGSVITGDLNGAFNLAPDTYYLIVTDSVSCIETFSFEVEESSDPVYQLVPPIDNCTGNQVLIRPIHIAPDPNLPPAAATEVKWFKSPGQVGEISSGPDSSDPNVIYTIDDTDWLNPELAIDNLPAGKYTYYFYVVCTGQEIPVEVEVYDTPEVVLEVSPETCFGDKNGKISLVSGDLPAYTYQVNSEPAGSLADLESRNFAPGTYTITIATPAGCAQVLSVEIEGPAKTLTLEPLTAIDPGCGAANGKIETKVSGGWAPYQVELIKDGTTFSTQSVNGPDIKINGLLIGTYSLTITDAEGCQINSEEVNLVDGPTQVLVDEQAICLGESVIFLPSVDPPASPVTYQWFYDKGLTQAIPTDNNPDGNGFVFNQNASGELEVSGLPANSSNYSFYVIASGPTICPGFVGEAKVKVFDIPTASFTVIDEACFGEKGQITVNAAGGSGNFTYSLNGAAAVSSNVFEVDPGTYEIEIITPESCNVLLENIEVKGPSAPLDIQNLEAIGPTCDLNNGLISFEVIGGYGTYSVEKFKNGQSIGAQAVPASGIVSIDNLGIGTYSFEITDSGSCLLILDSPVELEEVPTQISAPNQSICEGAVATIKPSVPGNVPNPVFTWYFDANTTQIINSGTTAGIDYQINSNGQISISGLSTSDSPVTYYVSVEGTGVCGVEPKPVTVTVNSIPNLKVSNPSVVCDPNGTVDLTDYIEGFNPNVYDYNVLSPNGTAMQVSELGSVAVSGDYRVSSSLKGAFCWNAPQRIKVLIAETQLAANFQYEIDLGGGTIITNGEIQIQEPVQFEDLSLGNAIIWNWDFGDGSSSSVQNPTHTFQNKGVYTVTLSTIDNIGCMSEFQMQVQVFDDYNVMIPNAFTPDGLKNQFFKPYYRGIASMEFYIFNTWGELIYQANSLEDQGWDGFVNGKPAPNGNYVYRGTFVTRSGEKLDKAGVFVLIR